MSSSPDQLAHLKSLVSQLQAKIERLESQAGTAAHETTDKVKHAVGDAVGAVKTELGLTPAQTLRIVLMGPPGAGESVSPFGGCWARGSDWR